MKNKWIIPVLAAITLLAACTPSRPAENDSTDLPQATQQEPQADVITGEDTPPLEPFEFYGLIFMREEEKLAQDVYLFLFDQWGLQIFQNIASSEQAHTDAVRRLLEIYELPDPAAQTQPGEFSNLDLQALYDQLTAQGSQSLADALKVGAAIEEIDILDLQNLLLEEDLPPDIRQVYENLLAGSCNHLSSFTSTLLRQTGETYTPQYMTWDAYQEALSSASGKGNGGGIGRRGGG